jgi:hypothetical protein
MSPQQKLFAILTSVALLLVIVELVRRRKLAEEYSVLWILIGVVILSLVVWYDMLLLTTRLIGAVSPTTTLFIFGIVFLILVNLHFSIKISKLSAQVRRFAQEMAVREDKSDEAGDNGH